MEGRPAAANALRGPHASWIRHQLGSPQPTATATYCRRGVLDRIAARAPPHREPPTALPPPPPRTWVVLEGVLRVPHRQAIEVPLAGPVVNEVEKLPAPAMKQTFKFILVLVLRGWSGTAPAMNRCICQFQCFSSAVLGSHRCARREAASSAAGSWPQRLLRPQPLGGRALTAGASWRCRAPF